MCSGRGHPQLMDLGEIHVELKIPTKIEMCEGCWKINSNNNKQQQYLHPFPSLLTSHLDVISIKEWDEWCVEIVMPHYQCNNWTFTGLLLLVAACVLRSCCVLFAERIYLLKNISPYQDERVVQSLRKEEERNRELIGIKTLSWLHWTTGRLRKIIIFLWSSPPPRFFFYQFLFWISNATHTHGSVEAIVVLCLSGSYILWYYHQLQ